MSSYTKYNSQICTRKFNIYKFSTELAQNSIHIFCQNVFKTKEKNISMYTNLVNPQNVAEESGSVHISWPRSRMFKLIMPMSTSSSK